MAEFKKPQEESAFFNQGVSKVIRLDMLQLAFFNSMSNNDYSVAASCLSSIFTEVFEFASEEERNLIISLERETTKMADEYKYTRAIIPGRFHDMLRSLNLLQKKYGLSMPLKEIRKTLEDDD